MLRGRRRGPRQTSSPALGAGGAEIPECARASGEIHAFPYPGCLGGGPGPRALLDLQFGSARLGRTRRRVLPWARYTQKPASLGPENLKSPQAVFFREKWKTRVGVSLPFWSGGALVVLPGSARLPHAVGQGTFTIQIVGTMMSFRSCACADFPCVPLGISILRFQSCAPRCL